MTTSFCGVNVRLWGDLALFVDGNSKITRSNGTYAEPAPNAFSLPHISSCPGSTAACRASCYVNGLQLNAPEIYARYADNSRVLHNVLLSVASKSRSARVFGDWIAENCGGGFRWHVSGDVLHDRHADWIARVCERASKVPFWIYTRTLSEVGVLCRARNLAVNVSADVDNYADALATARTYGARVCWMARTPGDLPDTMLPDDVIFPDYDLRGRELSDPTSAPWWQSLSGAKKRLVCPADFFGQSEQRRCGPCRKCLT